MQASGRQETKGKSLLELPSNKKTEKMGNCFLECIFWQNWKNGRTQSYDSNGQGIISEGNFYFSISGAQYVLLTYIFRGDRAL